MPTIVANWLGSKCNDDLDEYASELDEDASGLPFPEPLSRSSFLAPNFDPAEFLSSLRNRHQTLEDLRQELRDLDHLLNRELLDLVNANYGDFLSLGGALEGGEEKVEEVRVGLLSFKRDVQAIRDKVETRRAEIERLLKEKKRLREQANVARSLLDFADRVEELERRLLVKDASSTDRGGSGDGDESESESDADGPGLFDSESEESDDDDDDDLPDGLGTASVVSLKKLEHHIQKYVYLTTLSTRIGDDHPFLLNQRARMAKIRSTLALDLKAALEQTRNVKDKRDAKVSTVLRLYSLMGQDASNAVSEMKNLRL